MERLDNVALLQVAKNLSDGELAKFCSSNQRMRKFCSADNTLLWKERLIKFLGPYYAKFPDFNGVLVETMDKYRNKYRMNWRDYYISTMKIMDDHFIGLLYHGNYLSTLGREDLTNLVNIMEEEPFNVYYSYLYDDLDEDNKREKVDQRVYRSLTEEQKRWISPDVMVSYILMGVITDQDLINEILSNKRMKYEVVDVVSNTDHVTPQGARIIQEFLRSEVEKYNRGESSIIKNEKQSGWFKDTARELGYKY